MERAFVLLRRAGELCAAAQAATFLGYLYFSQLGNLPVSRGWLSRARSLCAQVGECVELGYVELAYAACDVANVAELEQSARKALEIARRFSDVDLEMRAVADLGLALVTQGRLREGLGLLDEAMTAAISGEVQYVNTGFIACSMLSGCLRAGDVERAEVWFQRIDEYSADAHPAPLYTHCRTTHGSVLALTGRWAEAEVELQAALHSARSTSVVQRSHVVAALADLRLGQGLAAEAAEVLQGYEDRIETVLPMAELRRAQGEHRAAVALVRRGLRELGPDSIRGSELLELLVRIELAAGDLAAAQAAADRLTALADASDSDELQATAAIARGRVAAASGNDSALGQFETALRLLVSLPRPLAIAQVRLEIARLLAADDPEDAGTEARAALDVLVRLGAQVEAAAARSLLAGLARPDTPPGGRSPGGRLDLSAREAEIAELVAAGLTNRAIAERLVLSVRTVENHIARSLGKLGLTNRTQLATLVQSSRSAR